MKSITKQLAIAIITLCIVAISLTIGCSDSKIINDDSTALQITINTNDIFNKSTAVTIFSVLVTEPESGDTVGAGQLVLNGSFLEGVVDSLPVNIPLLFAVQAMDIQNVIIYEGNTVSTIVVDELTQIDVQMRPVVPMIKLSPRYIDFTQIVQDSAFFVDAKVFNIDSLFGASFRLTFDESFCWIDSAVIDPKLAADSVIFFHGFAQDTIPSYAATVTQRDVNKLLVDQNGDGVMARFYFRTTTDISSPSNFSSIGLQVTGVSIVNQEIVLISDIYTDDCLLEFFIALP